MCTASPHAKSSLCTKRRCCVRMLSCLARRVAVCLKVLGNNAWNAARTETGEAAISRASASRAHSVCSSACVFAQVHVAVFVNSQKLVLDPNIIPLSSFSIIGTSQANQTNVFSDRESVTWRATEEKRSILESESVGSVRDWMGRRGWGRRGDRARGRRGWEEIPRSFRLCMCIPTYGETRSAGGLST